MKLSMAPAGEGRTPLWGCVQYQHEPRAGARGLCPTEENALTVGAVIGAVNKLESSVIPLLARPQGGVAASSRKFRAATEADAAGVVFHLFSSENHPDLAVSGGFAIIF